MLNNYSKININAVSGSIAKNYIGSFFKRFNLKSSLAEGLFDTGQPYIMTLGRPKPVVVIQIMICGDMEAMAEIMWKDDFDRVFGESQ